MAVVMDEYGGMSGIITISDLLEQLVGDLSEETVSDTFNGFVLHEMGSIPEDGAVIEIEAAGLHIKSANIVNHQVEKAVVHLKTTEEKE